MSQQFATGLVKVTELFAPMIERQLTGNGVQLDQYSKQCVVNAISAINTVLDGKGITWQDDQLDRNNITQILMNVAALKLNAAASPREVFFQLRNVKIGDSWKKQIEMGIEGDGNDAILARFGRDVKEVRQFWLVREGDDFEYPRFSGLEMEPPKWTPKGKGEVVRVVYPIIRNNNVIEYHIAEREDVTKNLIAHINNNLMNETFGLLPPNKKRFDATPEQAKQIAERKAELLKRAKELGLGALDDDTLQQWISPAWTEPQSRESMVIRKMRNNIVKKIPKDFGSAFIEMVHDAVTNEESYSSVQREIAEKANTVPIDIKAEVAPEPPRPERREEPDQDPPREQHASSAPQEPLSNDPPAQQSGQAFMDFGEPAGAAAGPDW
jgi:hypothetical protein